MVGGRPPSRQATPQSQAGMQMLPSSPRPMPPQDTPEYQIEMAYRKIPEHLRYQLKMDAGIIREKTLADLTFEDKRRMLDAWPNQRYAQHDFKIRNANTPTMAAAARNAMKRNSTSPGEQPEPSDSSPPDRKRQRRSPGDTAGPTASTPMSYPSTPQTMSAIPPPGQMQGPPQGRLQQQPPPTAGPMMMRPNMGGPPGQMQMNGQIPPPMQGQQRPPSGQPMMGGMQGQMGPQGQMGQGQMGQGQMGPPLGTSMGTMGISLHQVHNMQQGGQPNAGSPAGGPDRGGFNPGGPQPGPVQQQQQPFGGPKPPGRPGPMVASASRCDRSSRNFDATTFSR
ncbi:hypothetical protein NMY22_g19804 [Coprinellus aureogranulatus]|nr:hypothetical protein NMY22_g19804 [Coprinellus aureogranulatus]